MNYLKIAMFSLVLVSFNLFAYCSYDDSDCNAREHEARQQQMEYEADMEQMRNDNRRALEQQRFEMEREQDYQERERLHFEQDNTGVREIICDWSDSDC